MSQMAVIRVLLVSIFVLIITGCGDPNTEGSFFDADSGSHIQTWIYSHVDPAHTRTNQCMDCHGEDFDGGMSDVSCDSCHTEGDPLTTPNCISCHSAPPSDGTNTVYPNREGAHAVHDSARLNASPIDCDTCHYGAGSGTLNHYNQVVNVAFPPAYNGKSGIAAYDSVAKTCSKVSCHGGPRTQTLPPDESAPQSMPSETPHWFNGEIYFPPYDPDMGGYPECSACHVYGTDEDNSYFSGKHYRHVFELYGGNVNPDYACEVCHDYYVKLADIHFTDLNTPGIPEGAARATLLDKITDGYVYDLDQGRWTCSNSGSGCHNASTRLW